MLRAGRLTFPGASAHFGLLVSGTQTTPLKKAWRYLPDRGDEPTGVSVSVTVSLSVTELIARAAEHVQASEVMFIVGATLAHIGRLQRFFRAAHADSPEEARAIKTALDRITLPAQYQYSRRGR